MPDPYKPKIFLSYAHADEPEKPTEGEIKWLSFVTGYLGPALKHGAVELWLDRFMRGGDDWNAEIERKLRKCDIFILLVSRHSLSSGYIVEKEIPIIRDRQAKNEGVHFYPLLLTPTPKIALDLVSDRNLRPRDAKAFSDYTLSDRYRHMSDAADEIAEIAQEMVARTSVAVEKSIPPPRRLPRLVGPNLRLPNTDLEIRDLDSLRRWLKDQNREVSVAIVARAALRVLLLVVRFRDPTQLFDRTGCMFRACALAWLAVRYVFSREVIKAAGEAAGPFALGAAEAAFSASVADPHAAATWAARGAERVAMAPKMAISGRYDFLTYGTSAAAFDGYASLEAYGPSAGWQEIQADAVAVQRIGTYGMAELSIWPRGIPDWSRDSWQKLKATLSRKDSWEVWTEWYDHRLLGGWRGEEYELAFGGVPLEVWHKGPMAANAWIRERLSKGAEHH